MVRTVRRRRAGLRGRFSIADGRIATLKLGSAPLVFFLACLKSRTAIESIVVQGAKDPGSVHSKRRIHSPELIGYSWCTKSSLWQGAEHALGEPLRFDGKRAIESCSVIFPADSRI